MRRPPNSPLLGVTAALLLGVLAIPACSGEVAMTSAASCALIPPPASCPALDAAGPDALSDAGGVGATCVGASAEAIAAAALASARAPAPPDCPTCVGSAMPAWALFDFQPESCGYKREYGLTVFSGRVTVVAILAGW